eukprot:1722551-Pleurochrysis_carterae.AAC.1
MAHHISSPLRRCPFAHRARWRRQPQRTDRDTHPPSPRGCAEGGGIDMTDRQMADVPRDGATWGSTDVPLTQRSRGKG